MESQALSQRYATLNLLENFVLIFHAGVFFLFLKGTLVPSQPCSSVDLLLQADYTCSSPSLNWLLNSTKEVRDLIYILYPNP